VRTGFTMMILRTVQKVYCCCWMDFFSVASGLSDSFLFPSFDFFFSCCSSTSSTSTSKHTNFWNINGIEVTFSVPVLT
jgi:hypothetical protein